MGTFTPILNLYKPANGELDWGDEVDTNFDVLDALPRASISDWINVMDPAYGAVGDNSHDDTSNIQAAVDESFTRTNGGGIVYFPPGVYKISGAINVGDGSSPLNVTLLGTSHFSSSQGPIAGSFLYSSASNENILNVMAPAGLSTQALHIAGLELVYSGSVGTGICLDLTGGEAGGQISGATIDHVNCTKGGVGIKLGASVNVRFSNVSAHQCTKGWQFKNVGAGSDGPNLAQFENCYAQACSSYGVSVEGTLSHSRWTSCVFQAMTGPAFYVGSGAANVIFDISFDSCWWEFPGSDMFRIDGGWINGVFNACRFDGSNGDYGGGGARNVINLNAADASSASVTGLVFLAPFFTNLNGGKICALANADPSVSNDPYFGDIVILGAFGHGPIEGLRTPDLGAQMSLIHGLQFVDSDIVTNATNSLRPSYMLLNNGASVQMKEHLGVATVASGATGARPSATDAGAGAMWFDTTLGMPIFSNGSAWKKADGTAA